MRSAKKQNGTNKLNKNKTIETMISFKVKENKVDVENDIPESILIDILNQLVDSTGKEKVISEVVDLNVGNKWIVGEYHEVICIVESEDDLLYDLTFSEKFTQNDVSKLIYVILKELWNEKININIKNQKGDDFDKEELKK